jgi:hypothetical protein
MQARNELVAINLEMSKGRERDIPQLLLEAPPRNIPEQAHPRERAPVIGGTPVLNQTPMQAYFRPSPDVYKKRKTEDE